jgi:gas vesicle protein
VVGLGTVTAALSSGAVATSLTGVGIVIGAPVAAIAALSGAASTGLSVVNKKLERKVDKHPRIHSLAIAKHDTMNSYVSQALNDNRVSDKEFQLITREMQKYRQLKETLRSNFAQKSQTNPIQPDIEKIRNQIRQEFRKKLESSTNLN